MRIFSRTSIATALAVSVGTAVLTACGRADAGDGTQLALVGFAVPKAGNDAAEAAFATTPAGSGVTWRESYGASGDQSRAVAGGLDADYVHFSTTPDVRRLVDAGLVADGWDAGPN